MPRYDPFSLNLPEYIIPLMWEIYLHHLKVSYTSPEQEQDRHCTYKVTFRRARVTIVVVKIKKVLNMVSVCVFFP